MQNAQTSNAALEARVMKAHRSASMIVLTMAFSIAIYVIIGLVLSGSGKNAPESANVQLYFLSAAALLAMLSIGLRRSQFGRTRLEYVGLKTGVQGLLRHFTQMTILTVAVAELIGVLALVVIFFGGTQREVLLLGVVALFVAGSCYPRLSAWQKVIRYFDSISYQDSETDSERK
jgi:hypothetical protein